MINSKKRTATTITLMSIFAIVVILLYFYWSNRTQPFNIAQDHISQVQKYTEKDLEHYYPGTPREVVKLFAGMMQTLYNNPDDKNIKALALQIRKLYDPEFLNQNPEDKYLTDLYKDLSEWKKKGRKITNYLIGTDEQDNVVNGVAYSAQYISFTVQEHSKSTETWKVLLRQDKEKHWKILGWESDTEEKK